jgi:hypothetical protein
VGGPLAALAGLALIVVGMWSFFASMGSFGPPQYFWCVFAGMPLLMVGLVMCKFGYLGAMSRYLAREAVPVSVEAFNAMADGTQPGMRTVAKSVAKSVTEGIIEGMKSAGPEEPPK